MGGNGEFSNPPPPKKKKIRIWMDMDLAEWGGVEWSGSLNFAREGHVTVSGGIGRIGRHHRSCCARWATSFLLVPCHFQWALFKSADKISSAFN